MLKHPALAPTIFESLPRVWSHPPKTAPSTRTRSFLQTRPLAMADSSSPDFTQHGVETTSIPTAAGVSLTSQQKLLTGSVLDLFAGRPSLRKLSLWTDDASFVDPLTIAEGRKQYQAQWYGLAVVFSKIERLSCNVTSGGNPIEMDLKTKYTVKGLGSEQTITSKVLIHTDAATEKIVKVEDKWDGKLPDGVFVNVSLSLHVVPHSTQLWQLTLVRLQALRNLNSVTVPMMVSVPKSIEEEEAQQK
jgi:hypothetical protein